MQLDMLEDFPASLMKIVGIVTSDICWYYAINCNNHEISVQLKILAHEEYVRCPECYLTVLQSYLHQG